MLSVFCQVLRKSRLNTRNSVQSNGNFKSNLHAIFTVKKYYVGT